MYIPTPLDFTAMIGGTFDPILSFFTDEAMTDPLDLSDYSAELQISQPDSVNYFVLTPGSGLTLGGVEGTMAILLTEAQTATAAAVDVHWFLKLINTVAHTSGFPINGDMGFQLP